jgi:chain length determinant protein (polysaccharide antigen chain regulator)
MKSQELYVVNDKVSFRTLWQKVDSGKWLIASVTVLVVLVAVAYLLLATPTYKAYSYLLPPLVQSIQELNQKELNQKELNQKEYSVDFVFARFLVNMQSRSLRQAFFDEHKLLDVYTKGKEKIYSPEVFEKEFNQKLIVEKPSKTEPKPYTVISFELKNVDPSLSAHFLNAYVAYVSQVTRDELLAEVSFDFAKQISFINQQISSKKELAKQKRSDYIKHLEESLVIAKKLGMEQSQITQSDNKLNMDYNRGSRALEAELSVLKSRESDEFFIDGLRDLQERISLINNIVITPEKVAVVRVDQSAEIPYEVFRPKKSLIIVTAVVIGLMLGVFGVLVRGVFSRQVEVV